MNTLLENDVTRCGDVFVLALRRQGVMPKVKLGKAEQTIFNELSAWPKRQSEWIWGRACLKNLIHRVLNHSMDDFEILPRESGAPGFWLHGKTSEYWVSLSHTKHVTAAALSEHAVGIDVCELVDGPRMRTIASRVFIEGEAEAIGAHDSAENQTSVWAIKESALKLREQGVFVPGTKSITIASLNPVRLLDESRRVELFIFGDSVVAIATENRNQNSSAPVSSSSTSSARAAK